MPSIIVESRKNSRGVGTLPGKRNCLHTTSRKVGPQTTPLALQRTNNQHSNSLDIGPDAPYYTAKYTAPPLPTKLKLPFEVEWPLKAIATQAQSLNAR